MSTPRGTPVHHIPEAWPALLSPEQLAAYVGLSTDSLGKVCPVQPVDLGVNVLRYHRGQVDAWLNGLPPRLRRARAAEAAGEPLPEPTSPPAASAAEERLSGAVAAARGRAAPRRRRA